MKKKPYKILILFIFLLPLSFLLISDTSAISIEDTSLQDVINAGKIVVGIEPHVPPFEQRNPVTDEIEGFDPDIMQYIADDIGVSIEWVDVSWADIFPGLQNGDYDCIISTNFDGVYNRAKRNRDGLFTLVLQKCSNYYG